MGIQGDVIYLGERPSMRKENTNLPKVMRVLVQLFPDPKCALHYTNPWQLLVAVILSAQCTDKKVNEVTKELFKKYRIPGVGRKTANVVLGELYNTAEGIAVDTHVIRISRLLGFTKHRDAVKIEQDLIKIVPKKDWVKFSHMLILYGREYCTARCKHGNNCPLAKFYVKI